MPPEAPFIPGSLPSKLPPLARFLPPVPAGSAARWLGENVEPGAWVLDPFGASPSLDIEIAQAGYRVLVAANNPVVRFILETLAAGPGKIRLQAALAHLAAARIRDERLEPHLLALYHTPCNSCGALVSAEEYLWEKGAETPFARVYHCHNCGQEGEYPATPYDDELAKSSAATPLHYARILERVAALNDPDRHHAEEALQHYPPRAVYALGVLVNKLDIFPRDEQVLLSALMLVAFDHTNTLWPYPAARPRPRQLTIPPRYRERNAFRALERAVEIWSAFEHAPIPWVAFPESLDGSEGLCIFEGPMRDLAEHLSALGVQAVVSALPRPNQAFWSLSALWAGWLGGREAVKPFKSVLRRQRYDWRWHATAVHAALSHLVPHLSPDTPLFFQAAESEPGLLGSGLIAGEHAGLQLSGLAMRPAEELAQIHWRSQKKATVPESEAGVHHPVEGGGPAAAASVHHPVEGGGPAAAASVHHPVEGGGPAAAASVHYPEGGWGPAAAAIRRYLEDRGEPAPLLPILGAAFQALAAQHGPPPASSPSQIFSGGGSVDPRSPSDGYAQLMDVLEISLTYRGGFLRYNAGKELATGQWWLRQEPDSAPLADRVESAVHRYLHQHAGSRFNQIDQALCVAFPGLQTPASDLLAACVESYAEKSTQGDYRLRPEDDPGARQAEQHSIRRLLLQLGERLGFSVEPGAPILWKDSGGIYRFFVTASALLGEILLTNRHAPGRRLIVLPGSRANLALHKRRRDPRLDYLLRDWRFLKFRHLRALSENPLLQRSNLDEQLSMDALTYESPQIKLL